MSEQLEPVEVVIEVDTARWDAAWEKPALPSAPPPPPPSVFEAELEKVRRIVDQTSDDIAKFVEDARMGS